MAARKRLYMHARNVTGNIHDAVSWINRMGIADLVVSIHEVSVSCVIVTWRSTTKPQEQA